MNDGFRVALKKLMSTTEKTESNRPSFIKSLEWDLGETWMRDKMDNDEYANKVYDALCNTEWQHVETKEIFHCSWRYAGGIVARNRRYREDYMDFYASGSEGVVGSEIVYDFAKLGWVLLEETSDIKEEDKKDLKESSELIQQINSNTGIV